MLDAFIIDRIRRQREEQARRDNRIPLEIRMPERPPMSHGDPWVPDGQGPSGQDRGAERGVVDVDFTI
jgi:hypothetical protein